MFLGVWVYIRFFGDGGLGFRPYGGSLFPDAEKVTKKACSCVRPARWGSGFLRCGIDPGAAPTVCFAAPPLAVFGCAKRSLRSPPRINPSAQPSDVARGSRSKALSSLRSSFVGAAAGCDPLILLVLFVGAELACEGGLTADPFLADCTQSNCRSEPARDDVLPAYQYLSIVLNPCGSLACQRWGPDSRPSFS